MAGKELIRRAGRRARRRRQSRRGRRSCLGAAWARSRLQARELRALSTDANARVLVCCPDPPAAIALGAVLFQCHKTQVGGRAGALWPFCRSSLADRCERPARPLAGGPLWSPTHSEGSVCGRNYWSLRTRHVVCLKSGFKKGNEKIVGYLSVYFSRNIWAPKWSHGKCGNQGRKIWPSGERATMFIDG